ncbi:hypothetical protein [[Clostridium] fimetarium]|uniref:Uncharacterized protein n=1 Tax=[Clostridium] fimetarium TaxID=99656 RepID=A0A1I0QZN2_9FIRM|nr:hypothetical protein [[Clostridium] fimetarium]SEW33455.1 hypothetical protein SAMN05421659_110115 [[Clostridium] fimetarium]
MIKFVQQLLNNRVNRGIANISAKQLVSSKSKTLLMNKKGIQCMYDFYYIKYGIVYSINNFYYNVTDIRHKLMNSIPMNIYNMPSPRDYFTIATVLNLQLDDKTSYNVFVSWMKKKSYVFVEDIKANELPENIPERWENIKNEIRKKTKVWLNSGVYKDDCKYMLYADLFTIKGKVCLVTGSGKSDSCKAIADVNDTYDMVRARKINGVFECYSEYEKKYKKIDFFVHMASENFSGLLEIDLYTYLSKMHYSLYGCSSDVYYHMLDGGNNKVFLYVPYTDSLLKKSDMLLKYIR